MKRLFLVLLLCPLFSIAQPQQWYRSQLGDWSAGLHVNHAPIHDFTAPIIITYPDTVSHGAPDSIYTLKGAISDTVGPLVEYLVVGGGGAGDGGRRNRYYGGGGGGGEVRSGTMRLSGPVFISIGAGGNRGGYFADSATTRLSGWSAQADEGRETLLGPITAIGGKGAFSNPDSTATGYGGTSGNAFVGAIATKTSMTGGGGGGAGGAASGINGGPGLLSAITGAGVYYGAGGSTRSNAAFGTTSARQTAFGAAGPAASGCGGGGGSATAGQQFNGASGVVVIAYPNTYPPLLIGSSLTVSNPSTRTGYRVYIFSGGADTISLATASPGKTLLYRPDGNVKKITLEGNSSYGGATTVDVDTLEIGDGANGNLGSTPTILTNSSVLLYNKSRNNGVAGAISGTGSLRIRNNGVISMRSGPYSYTGSTYIEPGATLRIATPLTGAAPFGAIYVYGTLRLERTDCWQNVSGSSSAPITIYPGGTLYSYLTFNTLFNPVLAGGSIFMQGGVTSLFKSLQIRASMNVTENSVISANDVDGVTGMLFNNAPLTVAAGKTLLVDSPAHFYGSSTFTKNGTGTLDLYRSFLTGPVTINAGGMIVRNGGLNGWSTHSATVTIASGASLQYLLQAPFGSVPALYGNLSGAGVFKVSGYGLSIKGNNSGFTGPFSADNSVSVDSTIAGLSNSDSVSIDYLTLNSAGGGTYVFGDLTTGSGGITSTVAGSHILDFGGKNKSRNWGAAVTDGTGTLSLIKRGTGIYTTSASNTYTGTTTIAAGTFQIGSGGTSGTLGSGAVVDNGTLTFRRSNVLTVPNNISGSGILTQAGSGTTILTGTNTYTGNTMITAGTLQVGNGGTTGSLGVGDVVDNAALIFNRSNALTIGNVISGTGTVRQAGTGTTTLTDQSTYSGTTTIAAGTLVLNAPGLGFDAGINVYTRYVINSGATLKVLSIWQIKNSQSITINGGTFDATGSGFAGGTIVYVNNLSMNGGTILTSGSTNLRLGYIATGTWSLSGTNTIDQIILVKSTPTLHTFNVTSGTTTIAGMQDLAGYTGLRVVKSGAGVLFINASSNYSGGTTINAGTLRAGNANAFGTGSITLNGTSSILHLNGFTIPNTILFTGGATAAQVLP